MEPMEGERVVAHQAKVHAEASSAAVTKPQVSLSSTQYAETAAADVSDDEAVDEGQESDVLSRNGDDEDDSDFDAQESMGLAEAGPSTPSSSKWLRAGIKSVSALLRYSSDANSKELRPRLPRAMMRNSGQPEALHHGAKAKAMKKARPKQDGGGGTIRLYQDLRCRTDVHYVRQALREAHRNMPFDDFTKLVNFLFRGLKRIKEAGGRDESNLYLHVNDPAFRQATGACGTHSYAEQVLEALGFVNIAGLYWVWPEKHLVAADPIADWGRDNVDKDCPGLSDRRVHDMMTTLKSCQQGVAKLGKDFRGHFR